MGGTGNGEREEQVLIKNYPKIPRNMIKNMGESRFSFDSRITKVRFVLEQIQLDSGEKETYLI